MKRNTSKTIAATLNILAGSAVFILMSKVIIDLSRILATLLTVPSEAWTNKHLFTGTLIVLFAATTLYFGFKISLYAIRKGIKQLEVDETNMLIKEAEDRLNKK